MSLTYPTRGRDVAALLSGNPNPRCWFETEYDRYDNAVSNFYKKVPIADESDRSWKIVCPLCRVWWMRARLPEVIRFKADTPKLAKRSLHLLLGQHLLRSHWQEIVNEVEFQYVTQRVDYWIATIVHREYIRWVNRGTGSIGYTWGWDLRHWKFIPRVIADSLGVARSNTAILWLCFKLEIAFDAEPLPF